MSRDDHRRPHRRPGARGHGCGGREHTGQVTQYLAGVSDVLNRYDGCRGDRNGQAIITVAVDATRLGHASPLPAALVQDAAVGYLTGPQRTTSIESWRDTARATSTSASTGATVAVPPGRVPRAGGR
jgi:hypothetical protein